MIDRILAESWIGQLIGHPIAMFACLAFVAAAIAAWAASWYTVIMRRMWVDGSSPRLAISAGNVEIVAKEVNPLIQPDWKPIVAGQPLPVAGYVQIIAAHVVARFRNDGQATAYVTLRAVDGADDPKLGGTGDELFKVSDKWFTISPGAQINLDLYAGRPALEWNAQTVRVRWEVEVNGPGMTGVRDTAQVEWTIVGAPDLADGAPVWAVAPRCACTVSRWRRTYVHRRSWLRAAFDRWRGNPPS